MTCNDGVEAMLKKPVLQVCTVCGLTPLQSAKSRDRQYLLRKQQRAPFRCRAASEQKCWRISEAGLRPRKTPAYFAWLLRENWKQVSAASTVVLTVWLVLRYYNSGGFGGAGNRGGGGSGGSDGGGGGGAGGGSSSSGDASTFLQVSDEERRNNARQRPIHLTLVSFAVTRRAYESITERFAEEYEAATGIPVRFRLSFGGSGTQARAVVDGLPGDIVALALPLDIMKIEEAGLISKGWQDRAPNEAIVAESVVALVTRKGNPKNIRDWSDLTRSDVEVITANPKTAGVARWNFLALWGNSMHKGDEAAHRFVTDVFHRVPIQPRDAREASDVFYNQGQGDVLLNYENEVYLTNASYSQTHQDDKVLPYVVPQKNIRVETPVAIVDRNLDRLPTATRQKTRDCAEAFVQYLFKPEAQKEFAACGFRMADAATSAKLPQVKSLWTVDAELSGWDVAQKKFFASGGICDQIQKEVGDFRQRQRKGKA